MQEKHELFVHSSDLLFISFIALCLWTFVFLRSLTACISSNINFLQNPATNVYHGSVFLKKNQTNKAYKQQWWNAPRFLRNWLCRTQSFCQALTMWSSLMKRPGNLLFYFIFFHPEGGFYFFSSFKPIMLCCKTEQWWNYGNK